MDVLGMYLLQRVSNELTIQKNESFENRFVAPVPDSTAARVTHEAYGRGVLIQTMKTAKA